MSEKANPAGGQVNRSARLDDWIARAFASFGSGSATSEGARRIVFERLLLLHLAVRMATHAYPEPVPGSATAWALSGGSAAALALALVPRAGGWALGLALGVLLGLLLATFPQTSNHGFLELWCVLMLLVSGRGREEADQLALQAIRASIALLLFYTGLQKVMHGTYFDAQFLAVEIVMKPEFASVFGLLSPADEMARLQSLDPSLVGSGPYRSTAPLLLMASNLVYIFELTAPFLLVWRRTRRWAVVAVLAFTVAIQSGAREAYFGGVLVNGVLLFWPRDLHARAWPLFVAFYAILLGLHWLAPTALVVR